MPRLSTCMRKQGIKFIFYVCVQVLKFKAPDFWGSAPGLFFISVVHDLCTAHPIQYRCYHRNHQQYQSKPPMVPTTPFPDFHKCNYLIA